MQGICWRLTDVQDAASYNAPEIVFDRTMFYFLKEKCEYAETLGVDEKISERCPMNTKSKHNQNCLFQILTQTQLN